MNPSEQETGNLSVDWSFAFFHLHRKSTVYYAFLNHISEDT